MQLRSRRGFTICVGAGDGSLGNLVAGISSCLATRSLMRPGPTDATGVHFMQVSKWLGHSTFRLTLDVYGDYIPKEDSGAANNLPEPLAPTKQADLPSNVVQLFGRLAT